MIFFIGLIGVVAIGWLSLVPGDLRPHTPASGYVEHFVAYLAVAICLCAGTNGRNKMALIVLALAAMSASLEVAQLGIPGRSGEIWGAVASSAGALTGGVLAPAVQRILRL
jgi:VanZ family protein